MNVNEMVNAAVLESFNEKFSRLEFHLMNHDELYILGCVTEVDVKMNGMKVGEQTLLESLGYKATSGEELYREMGGIVDCKDVVIRFWKLKDKENKIGAGLKMVKEMVERLEGRQNLTEDEQWNLENGKLTLVKHGWEEVISCEKVVSRNGSLLGDQRKMLCGTALKVWCGGLHGMEELEKSWVTEVGESCSKGHSHVLFGKFSLTCTNAKKVVVKKWVEEPIGIRRSDGDMTGGAGAVTVVRTGVYEEVGSSPCGEVPYGIVELNSLYELGLLELGDWYNGIRLITGEVTATEKEINLGFTGGKRKYGLKKVNSGLEMCKELEAEFLRNHLSHVTEDGTHASKTAMEVAGTRNHEGRLKGKSGKIRSGVDGKLKGCRVNGSRTELPKDFGCDGWFEVFLDGVREDRAYSATEVLERLLEVNEVPNWKELEAEVKELVVEELENLAEAQGRIGDRLASGLIRAVDESECRKPKELLLLLGVGMSMRDAGNAAWMKREKRRAQGRLRVDFAGGEGRMEVGLWRKMKFEGDERGEVVKTRSAVGDALWAAMQDAVAKLG